MNGTQSVIMGLKTCLRGSGQAIPNQACSATKTSKKIEISLVAISDTILSHKQIIKVLIRLRRPKTGFSCVEDHIIYTVMFMVDFKISLQQYFDQLMKMWY